MNRTGYFLSCILIASSLVASMSANASPCDFQAGAHKIQVKDYKAVGDGKTDDGPAIRAALKAAIEGPKPGYLEFESGKAYRITTFEETYAMRVMSTQNITLQGNGAELLLLPPNKVLRIAESSDINVCGLTIDYSPLPFTQGMVVSTNPKTGTFDIEIEEGFDVPEVDSDSVSDNSDVWEFAMPYKHANKFEKRVNIKVVHAATGKRRIRITPSDQKQWKRLVPNQTHLVMAMPGKGQTGNFAFQILQNEGVSLANIKIFAVPKATFYVADNHGAVNFINIEQRIKPGTNRVMTGWRGIFHAKDNRAPISWADCHLEGAFDDAINVNAMYQLVTNRLNEKKWEIRDLSRDGIPNYKVGDTIQAINISPIRETIGEAKIVSVDVAGGRQVIGLSKAMNLIVGQPDCVNVDETCGSRIVNLDAANKGSSISGCTIYGSVRLRGTAMLEESKLDGFLQITSSPTREGPSPENVLVRKNELRGTIKIGADANPNTTKQNWDRGERWAKNIRFERNTIYSKFKADGASLDLVGNEMWWPKTRKFQLQNCGPVNVSNMRVNGVDEINPLARISIGHSMSVADLLVW